MPFIGRSVTNNGTHIGRIYQYYKILLKYRASFPLIIREVRMWSYHIISLCDLNMQLVNAKIVWGSPAGVSNRHLLAFEVYQITLVN